MAENYLKTRWMGHSSWELETAKGKKLVIDPWYTDNPKNPGDVEEVEADYVLITHDHWDHVKDVPELIKKGAKVVAQPEVEKRFVQDHGVSGESFIRINMGGTVGLEEDLKVTLFHAFHSADSGAPGGLIIRSGGVTIMNVGDTALHKDLELYGEIYQPTLLMLPIGDRFTMGPRDAARAVSMVQPKHYVPMHYSTFPAIDQNPKEFEKLVKETGVKADSWIPEPGEEKSWTKDGSKETTSVK
ncbi:metal-dependent hydrolase [Virgibacillus sediminis]|uniref:UPF0173 metal-dependent hydrolase ACFODW_15420 n=1 Tax=Virgibacillus sediminis TaxID=202260 RepID=A0ABV7A9D6_9BACI